MLRQTPGPRRKRPISDSQFQRRIRRTAYVMLLATAGLLVVATVVATVLHPAVWTAGPMTGALFTLRWVIRMNSP